MQSETGSPSGALPLHAGVSGTGPMTVRVFMPELDANTLPIVPAGFVHCIRLINASDDSAPLTGAEVKRRVANMLPPGKLFSRDMMVLPVLHTELLEWINYWRAEINMEDAPIAAMALASQLYEDDEHDLDVKLLMEDYRDHTRKPTAPSPKGLGAGDAPGPQVRGFNPSARYLGVTLVGDGTRRPDYMGIPSQDARLNRRSQESASQGGNLGMDIGGPGPRYFMVPLEATIAIVDVITPRACQAAAKEAVPMAVSAATQALAPMAAALGPLGNAWTAVATPWIVLTAVVAPETAVPSTTTGAATATAQATLVQPVLRTFSITWRSLPWRAVRRVR